MPGVEPLLTPLLWTVGLLPLLLWLQRWIHQHLHGLALLTTGRPGWAIAIYALILFPGVFLHELSHWVFALLLGVRTGAFSVLPRLKEDGTLQLGYVEYYKSHPSRGRVGPLRESLIGAAPLFAGAAVIWLVGKHVFDITAVAELAATGDTDLLLAALRSLFTTGDLFVWLYLLFAVSNAMMPSPSDRRAWPMVGLAIVVASAIALLLDQDGILLQRATPLLGRFFTYVALSLGLTIVIDLLFVMAIGLLEAVIGRLRGQRVRYNG